MQETIQDAKYALRQLHKVPGFSLAVIATIALTISLTAAVFSVVYAVLVQPLPYKQPDRIVAVQPRSASGYVHPASYPDYLDWRQTNSTLANLAGYDAVGSINFESPEGPVALHLVSTTDNFFAVFGVAPLLGRTFAEGEDQPGRNDVAVLGYDVWQHHFRGRASVIGEAVKLDGNPYSVIGVMPPTFRFPVNEHDAIYTPIHPTKQQHSRGNYWLTTIARLKDGVTLSQAESDMARVVTITGTNDPAARDSRIGLVDLPDFVVGDTHNPLRLLLYSVLALLAIGCVNIAGLLLVRGVKRDRELALRTALGAAKARIMRQILTEAFVYCLLGTAAGILLAYGLLRLTRTLLATALARGSEVLLNANVLMVSVAAAILIVFLASLAPALRVFRIAPSLRLRAGGASVGSSRGQRRLRAIFVVTQFALGMVLLVISGLLFVTLMRLRNADLGFSSDHILTMELDLSSGRYGAHDVVKEFYNPLLEKTRAIPGVQAAGLIQMLPIQNWGWNSEIHMKGFPPPAENSDQLAEYRIVSPGYYKVFQSRLIRGRLLDGDLDTPTSQPVAIVNEAFVRKFIPAAQDPIGQQLEDDEKTTIVGVVKNVRQNIYQPPLAEVDYAISQIPAFETLRVVGRMQLVIRCGHDPKSIIPDLRHVLNGIDPSLPFRAPETMAEVVSDKLVFERLENWLFGSFAAVALLLAVVGLYGLISHEVEVSARDIGLRVALGATRKDILLLVYRRVMRMVGLGLGIGLVLIICIQRYFQLAMAIHYKNDVGYIAALSVFLALLGLSAASFPAFDAARIEPIEVLKDE